MFVFTGRTRRVRRRPPENKKAKTVPSVAPVVAPVAAPAPAPVTEETYFCAATQAYDWGDSDEEPDLEMFM